MCKDKKGLKIINRCSRHPKRSNQPMDYNYEATKSTGLEWQPEQVSKLRNATVACYKINPCWVLCEE